MDIILTLFYATFIGFYNIFKKLATMKSKESTILVIYTTTTFILTLLWLPFGLSIPASFIPIFALKGFLLATSWFLVLKVLKTADLSLVMITGVLSSVLSFILGITIFHETTNALQIIGSTIIVLGVAIINFINGNREKKETKLIHFVVLFLSALISSTSNVIDKYTTTHLTPFQTQFWFAMFVALFSWIYFGIECVKSKEFLIKKEDLKNWRIYPIGILLFIGDVILFFAYKVPGSKMITISILLQLKVVISIIVGAFIFKEEKLFTKISVSLFVIAGAILIAL